MANQNVTANRQGTNGQPENWVSLPLRSVSFDVIDIVFAVLGAIVPGRKDNLHKEMRVKSQ